MKGFDKIKESLKVYEHAGMQKEMSKSQFSKFIPAKKSNATTEAGTKKLMDNEN